MDANALKIPVHSAFGTMGKRSAWNVMTTNALGAHKIVDVWFAQNGYPEIAKLCLLKNVGSLFLVRAWLKPENKWERKGWS